MFSKKASGGPNETQPSKGYEFAIKSLKSKDGMSRVQNVKRLRAARLGFLTSPLCFQQRFTLDSAQIQTFSSGDSLAGPLHSGFAATKISIQVTETSGEILHA